LKETTELLQAVVVLKQNPDFQRFLAELGRRGEDAMEKLIKTADRNLVDLLRGEARAYVNLLDMVNSAETSLEKHKTQR
jgi:DNA polymerase II large subunit